MLIGDDSALRRLPSQLDRRQTLFFDGIRYSIEMADLAHLRLQKTLLDMIRNGRFEAMEDVSAILDAWSIVDSTYRLRKLLQRAPGLKRKSPGLQVFLRKTVEIETLRHSVQHLDQQIHNIVEMELPALGELSWFAKLNPDDLSGHVGLLMPGTAFKSKGHPFVNPLGKTVWLPVDLITLRASRCSVCLSDVMREIERLARGIDQGLTNEFEDLPRAGSDMFLFMEIAFRDPQPEKSPNT